MINGSFRASWEPQRGSEQFVFQWTSIELSTRFKNMVECMSLPSPSLYNFRPVIHGAGTRLPGEDWNINIQTKNHPSEPLLMQICSNGHQILEESEAKMSNIQEEIQQLGQDILARECTTLLFCFLEKTKKNG